jgi:hypothetical protein
MSNKPKPEHHAILAERKASTDETYYLLEYSEQGYASANCKGIDTEMFFPDIENFKPEDMAPFKRMCGTCPVKQRCLEWALVHERYGVWGGMTPRERIVERRRRGWGLLEPHLFVPIGQRYMV